MNLTRVALLAAALAGVATSGGSAAPAGPVSFFPAGEVAAAFAQGRPLYEVNGYKVHASRREAPGLAEVHTADTDIIYMLDGVATLVTGGTVVEARTTAPQEIRGRSIAGGQQRRLVKGDVMIVPNGTPHWFSQVDGPVLYYVVKVASMEGR